MNISSATQDSDVTVIGLGPMGRALAWALLQAGKRVTVWNRTPGKAGELLARGAVAAPTPGDALIGARLAVFCVVDDDAVSSVMEQAIGDQGRARAVRGLTLVDLTADSPVRTRALAAQLDSWGVTLVDGAIMTPAATIGTDAARILYSGPARAYEEHRGLLAAFGGTAHYLGGDVAAAASYDVALLSIFWTSFAGVTQAMALARAEGVDAEEFGPHAVAISQLLVDLLPGLTADFAAARFAGAETSSIDSVSTSLEHLRSAYAEAGVPPRILDAVHSLLRDSANAGYGDDAPIRLAAMLKED